MNINKFKILFTQESSCLLRNKLINCFLLALGYENIEFWYYNETIYIPVDSSSIQDESSIMKVYINSTYVYDEHISDNMVSRNDATRYFDITLRVLFGYAFFFGTFISINTSHKMNLVLVAILFFLCFPLGFIIDSPTFDFMMMALMGKFKWVCVFTPFKVNKPINSISASSRFIQSVVYFHRHNFVHSLRHDKSIQNRGCTFSFHKWGGDATQLKKGSNNNWLLHMPGIVYTILYIVYNQ